MSRIAKISVIPKQYSKGKTLESALADHNMTRYPGTGVTLFPFRENNGVYRTALDPNSTIYNKIEDPKIREAKQAAALKKMRDLEEATQLRLDGKSSYYNYGYAGRKAEDGGELKTIQPYKLIDGENIFNLDDPYQEITFAWLSVHPRIASSLEAYNNGEYPPDTVFYVKDDEAEAAQIYAAKKEFTNAIIMFDGFSLEKRRRIARLCDLPVNEDSREETVYNMMNDFLNKKEIERGAYKGQTSLKVFNLYASLDNDTLHKKDLIELAFKNQIFRINKGKVFEGAQEIFESRDELEKAYLDDKYQDKVLALEKKLKLKKLANV